MWVYLACISRLLPSILQERCRGTGQTSAEQLKQFLNKFRFDIPANAGIQENQQPGPRPLPG
jgi:hypothetical protein